MATSLSAPFDHVNGYRNFRSEDEVRKFWKLAVATSVVAVSGLVAGALPAGATPPTGYGFDGSPHTIVGAGSDTTYKAQLGLTELYMSTSITGCEKITTVGPNLGKCNTVAGAEQNVNLGNYQGDTISQANPTGSSAGIGSMNGQNGSSTTYAGTVNPLTTRVPASAVPTSPRPVPTPTSRVRRGLRRLRAATRRVAETNSTTTPSGALPRTASKLPPSPRSAVPSSRRSAVRP
jgi:hypothetical protein